MKKKVIVVGAGVAGLTSAIRLQHAGYEVEIYEKEALPGGKMNRIEMEGYQFDLGPTIVMMPELYREIFELCGRDPDDYIPMEQLDPMYRVYFSDQLGHPYDVSSELTKLTKMLETISEEDVEGFFHYLYEINKRFLVAKNHILQRPFRKQRDFYNWPMLKKALKLKTFDTADQFISQYIKSRQLKQMISFQTLYIGISPFKSPSFYSMIPMIQFLYGVWFIKGGMYTMAQSLVRLFEELGGKIHCNQVVQEIVVHNQRAIGIKVDDKQVDADYVMCNADFPYAVKHLVKDHKAKGKYTDKKIDSMQYSCSCFLLYLGLNKKYGDDDQVHSFVFSEDLDKNLQDIFAGNKLEHGSFYVYMASKMDPSMAPAGKDGMYILMPVSNVATSTYDWDEQTIAAYRRQILTNLQKIPGFEQLEQDIVVETCMTPVDFERRFHAYNGATFGLSPNLLQSNHFRPQSKSNTCENLYYTGSSTHPGAGVPIVMLSAKIAAQELMLDDRGVSS